MATHDVNLADRRGSLVEAFKGYDPRVIFFYFALAALLLVLAGGLAYQQLFRSVTHNETERTQNQRRILVPGPRGNILDRHGEPLALNRPRFAVVLELDELKAELRREHFRIHKNYVESATDKTEVPTYGQLEQLARVSVAQRYLELVNRILGRNERVDSARLQKHFSRDLLLPFTLLDDLTPEEFAKLIERLPVISPLSVYTFNSRYYPHGSLAAHTLGYVRPYDEIEADELPGADLPGQFKMKGTTGKNGLERQFDSLLQGEAGYSIIRVDPAGFKVASPDLPHRLPIQGKELTTSLDLELQQAAEDAIGDQTGAAVALDVHTGEVLVLASKPDYDLNLWYPHMTTENYQKIQEENAEFNLALDGLWSPGSTFKILVSIAGLRSGLLSPDDDSVDCEGYTRIGNTVKGCDNGLEHHGHLKLAEAIGHSCDIYFYLHGIAISPGTIAAEARRFHLDQPTGIELPGEVKNTGWIGGMIVPDPAWKKEHVHQPWSDGDTANMAIGQGYVQFTPLQMACFAASIARGETFTQPTLVHDPNRPPQHTEAIGLTPAQRAVIIDGMKGAVNYGTAAQTMMLASEKIPGVQVAGKTGTAQKKVKEGTINIAWFICFAPADNPQIAVAAAIRGENAGEAYAGGRYAAPVANAVLKKYFEQKNRAPSPLLQPFKSP